MRYFVLLYAVVTTEITNGLGSFSWLTYNVTELDS